MSRHRPSDGHEFINELSAESLINDRMRAAELMMAAISDDARITNALLIGSVGNGGGDEFSDLDYYLFTKLSDLPHEGFHEWLTVNSVNTGLYVHDKSEPKKHTFVSNTSRVDIHLLDVSMLGDLRNWPHLFFDKQSIIKDIGGELGQLIESHTEYDSEIDDEANNFAGYAINLLDTIHEFIKGDSVVALSHALTGLIESKSRIILKPQFATALWREPSRHAEKNMSRIELTSLYKIAFIRDMDSMRQMLMMEIDSLLKNPQTSEELISTFMMLQARLLTKEN